MDLTVLAAGAPAATVAHAASHLTGRQVVPGLAIITVLLLALTILYGPGGPRPRPRRPARLSRAASRPVHAADQRDPPEDVAAPSPRRVLLPGRATFPAD